MQRRTLADMTIHSCHLIKAHPYFSYCCFSILLLSATLCASAQDTGAQQSSNYQKVITDRAAKIVQTLAITDSVTYNNVVGIIAEQYAVLNTIQQDNTTAVASIKKQEADKNSQAIALKNQEEKKLAALTQQHAVFIAHLKEQLNDNQIELVKDGMTYRVFPITYAAYQDMIPTLTAAQKEKIYAWLKEARELAMDAESSDKKHAVFGKYKGRINNYLSAQGYDVKKEGEAWARRIQAAKEAKQPN